MATVDELYSVLWGIIKEKERALKGKMIPVSKQDAEEPLQNLYHQFVETIGRFDKMWVRISPYSLEKSGVALFYLGNGQFSPDGLEFCPYEYSSEMEADKIIDKAIGDKQAIFILYYVKAGGKFRCEVYSSGSEVIEREKRLRVVYNVQNCKVVISTDIKGTDEEKEEKKNILRVLTGLFFANLAEILFKKESIEREFLARITASEIVLDDIPISETTELWNSLSKVEHWSTTYPNLNSIITQYTQKLTKLDAESIRKISKEAGNEMEGIIDAFERFKKLKVSYRGNKYSVSDLGFIKDGIAKCRQYEESMKEFIALLDKAQLDKKGTHKGLALQTKIFIICLQEICGKLRLSVYDLSKLIEQVISLPPEIKGDKKKKLPFYPSKIVRALTIIALKGEELGADFEAKISVDKKELILKQKGVEFEDFGSHKGDFRTAVELIKNQKVDFIILTTNNQKKPILEKEEMEWEKLSEGLADYEISDKDTYFVLKWGK